MPALTPAERIRFTHTYTLDPDMLYTVVMDWHGYNFEATDLDAGDVQLLLQNLLHNALQRETGREPKRYPLPMLEAILDEDDNMVPSRFDIRNQKCLDCELDTVSDLDEYYMVTHDIWARAVPENHGMICIGCLEKRLGRELNSGDFLDVPVNRDPAWAAHHSPRLRDRLARS